VQSIFEVNVFDVPWVREFGRAEGAVTCDREGVFVGCVPLLRQVPWQRHLTRWEVRPQAELERALSAFYGLPIDVRSKAGGLAAVAAAFNREDLAVASFAAVHLEFPDPPRFAKGAWPESALLKLAGELWRSGLLKDWDPADHPRTGEKPNPGWFAEKPEKPKELTTASPTSSPASRSNWPSKKVNEEIRTWVEKTALRLGERAEFGPAGELELEIEAFLKVMEPLGLNEGEDRVTAQLRANFDPPKSLQELQTPPENRLGYDRHHIVEQNPANVEKGAFEKFGRAAIDDPSNTVWVPGLKHEKISGDYSRKAEDDSLGGTLRNAVKNMNFAEQRAAGLAELRKYGVLK